jgi:ATP-dependent RNA helicase DDX35
MGDYDPPSAFVPALYKPAALLPITRHKQALLYTIETYPVTIVVAATGSGKTTQIPQFLQDGGWCADGKMVAVTQVSICLLSIQSITLTVT